MLWVDDAGIPSRLRTQRSNNIHVYIFRCNTKSTIPWTNAWGLLESYAFVSGVLALILRQYSGNLQGHQNFQQMAAVLVFFFVTSLLVKQVQCYSQKSSYSWRGLYGYLDLSSCSIMCVKAYSRNCILMHRLHSSVDPDRHDFVHQGIKLEDLKVLRVLFGCFPTYRSRSGFALSGCWTKWILMIWSSCVYWFKLVHKGILNVEK